jgi:transcriptional regulator with XRE-family HTH domain
MNNLEKIAIGNKIKELRESKLESQGTFAGAIGIKQAYLSLIENGERDLSLDLAKKIAEYCGVLVNEIITNSNVALREGEGKYLPSRSDCSELRLKCEMQEKTIEKQEKEIEYLRRQADFLLNQQASLISKIPDSK